jgi:hypothetical protein
LLDLCDLIDLIDDDLKKNDCHDKRETGSIK